MKNSEKNGKPKENNLLTKILKIQSIERQQKWHKDINFKEWMKISHYGWEVKMISAKNNIKNFIKMYLKIQQIL